MNADELVVRYDEGERNFNGIKLYIQDVDIPEDIICRHGNLIWNTIMPDKTIKKSPYIGIFPGR
ncbi:hypothetical protein NIES267_05950 [Calothrix parasitica NIES-267]|uniref:Uncharacterized protein n=1 Tax=Calothrix parasitica NIES-267 TaxID=1973488 RepID=A0A1Z4LIQ5_9CYAN|nr:hypothetical protein NIES267_05950 [Calothrix parasitica NIES-267]